MIYLCIEGLDGSGKSTLFDGLKLNFQKYCLENQLTFDVACPTQITCPESKLEKFYFSQKLLQHSSFFRMLIYALRSYQTAKRTNWKSDFVLGDRSIVTSYVTRWKKLIGGQKTTIFVTNTLEPLIPSPTYVIYLNAPHEVLMDRLEHRNKNRDIDETPERSMEMRSAYEEIMIEQPINRIKNAKWIVIDIDKYDTKEVVLSKVWKRLESEVLTNKGEGA